MYRILMGICFIASTLSNETLANDNQQENKMQDFMTKQLSNSLKASAKLMNDPEFISARAKYIRSLYEALVKEGFSKGEALQLVSSEIQSSK